MLNAPVDGINHVLSQLIKHKRFDLDPIADHPYTRACYLLQLLLESPHPIEQEENETFLTRFTRRNF
jgi:hypothetical protein